LAGCGGPKYKGDQRFPLSGSATLDGQPIDLGSISFVGGDATKTRFSGGVITDGKYDVPEENGPTAGKYRVEISWLKRTGKQLKDAESGMYDERIEALPEKYNKNSELSADVPAPDNTYNFDLKSK
jgi:hypothetical protein